MGCPPRVARRKIQAGQTRTREICGRPWLALAVVRGVGVSANANGLRPWRRSVCVSLVLEVGVRLRVVDSGAVLRWCQEPEVSADDT